MMKIKIPRISARMNSPQPIEICRPAWYKADQELKNLYCSQLREKLANIQLPQGISCCTVNCNNIAHIHLKLINFIRYVLEGNPQIIINLPKNRGE